MRRLIGQPFWIALAALVWWVAIAGTARAQDGEELLLLDLCVDGDCVGIAPVLVVGEDFWVDAAALANTGLSLEGVPRRQIRNRPFVRVADLPEVAQAQLDRQGLRLDLRRKPETLPLQRRGIVRLRVAPDVSGAVSYPLTATLNYAASLGDLAQDSLFLDGALGRGNLALRSNAAWDEDAGWRRGLSRLEWDQPEHLRRWSLGDQFATSPELLAGSALLGGLGIERAFEQDPFLVTFPQPYLAGVLEVPGSVEIYSNGVLIGRQQLSAGPFSLENIGLPSGRSDLEVVFRDSFGNRRQLESQSFYVGSGLLAKGLSSYAARVGVPRTTGLGGRYADEPALQAWYRRGVADGLTLGGAVEADADGEAAYGSLAATLGPGEVGLSLAYADSDFAGAGAAVAASYSYQRRGFGAGIGWRWRDTGFRSLSETERTATAIRADGFASLSYIFENSLSLRVNAARSDPGVEVATYNYGFDIGYRPRGNIQAQLSVQRSDRGRVEDTVVLFNLALAFDGTRNRFTPSSASLGAEWREGGDVSGSADVRRFRPLGEGFGYDLSLREGQGPGVSFGRVEYQGRYGRYTAEGQHIDGQGSSGRIEASGSVTAIGGRAYFSPPTETGFALVRVPGVAGLEVQRENQSVGRTDAKGDLLVRNLLPFYPNKVGIDPDSIAMGYRHGELSRFVHSPHSAGALVEFDVRPLRAVHGRLLVEGEGEDALSLGHVRRSSREGEVDHALGGKGRFYQEDLPPGETEWTVTARGRTYLCRLQVPDAAGLHDLGRVPCQALETRDGR